MAGMQLAHWQLCTVRRATQTTMPPMCGFLGASVDMQLSPYLR